MTLPRPLKVGDVCRCRNGDVVYVFRSVKDNKICAMNFKDGADLLIGIDGNTGAQKYDVTEILASDVDLSCMGEQHPQSKNMKLCHQNGNFIYMDAYHPPKKTWKLIFTQPNFVHHIKDIEADSEAEAYEKLKASGAIRLEQKE